MCFRRLKNLQLLYANTVYLLIFKYYKSYIILISESFMVLFYPTQVNINKNFKDRIQTYVRKENSSLCIPSVYVFAAGISQANLFFPELIDKDGSP